MVDGHVTLVIEVNNGLHQGCTTASTLFSLYLNSVLSTQMKHQWELNLAITQKSKIKITTNLTTYMAYVQCSVCTSKHLEFPVTNVADTAGLFQNINHYDVIIMLCICTCTKSTVILYSPSLLIVSGHNLEYGRELVFIWHFTQRNNFKVLSLKLRIALCSLVMSDYPCEAIIQ